MFVTRGDHPLVFTQRRLPAIRHRTAQPCVTAIMSIAPVDYAYATSLQAEGPLRQAQTRLPAMVQGIAVNEILTADPFVPHAMKIPLNYVLQTSGGFCYVCSQNICAETLSQSINLPAVPDAVA
jgi:hypothetical protein